MADLENWCRKRRVRRPIRVAGSFAPPLKLKDRECTNKEIMSRIVVLGAGVVGLTTALELKRDNAKHDITVVAAHLPGDLDSDYTLPFAGANWHSFAGPSDSRLQRLDGIGYRKYLDLAANEPCSGVWTVKNLLLVTKDFNKNSFSLPWFKDIVDDFNELTEDQLIGDAVAGFTFKGVVITTPIYLNYLLQKNLEAGITVRRIPKVNSLAAAKQLHTRGEADIVINCGGLLVKDLVDLNDPKRNYTIRGQVLHIRNCAKAEVEVEGFEGTDDEMLYLMPRKEGGCIIGGCFQQSSNREEDKALTQRIIDRAIKYVPELIDPDYRNNPQHIDIVRVNVGFRPFREDGARIEIDANRPWLIHNYGAGGGGYQGSYGMAAEVVQLVHQLTRKGKL